MSLQISSFQNIRIKNLLSLQKPKERRAQEAFVVEGVREVSLAQQGGFTVRELFLCPAIYRADGDYPVDTGGVSVYEVTEELFSKIAYRENTGGIVAVAHTRALSLDSLPHSENPVYLVLEQVEKPGNVGAMLRTADAAGVSGVIVCDAATDFYNPNVVRSSVGCLFTVPVAAASADEVKGWLTQRGVATYAAALTPKARSYHHFDYTGPTAFLLGAEATGLSDYWLRHANQQVIIPMRGKIDSMNVSNAAAVLIFEAMRQRNFS